MVILVKDKINETALNYIIGGISAITILMPYFLTFFNYLYQQIFKQSLSIFNSCILYGFSIFVLSTIVITISLKKLWKSRKINSDSIILNYYLLASLYLLFNSYPLLHLFHLPRIIAIILSIILPLTSLFIHYQIKKQFKKKIE